MLLLIHYVTDQGIHLQMIKVKVKTRLKLKLLRDKFFIILLLVTFGFLILSSRLYVFMLCSMLYNYRKSPYSFAGFYLYYNIAQKLHYTNSGINFFLYVISGQKFRRGLIKLFRSVKQNEHSQNASCVSSATELYIWLFSLFSFIAMSLMFLQY